LVRTAHFAAQVNGNDGITRLGHFFIDAYKIGWRGLTGTGNLTCRIKPPVELFHRNLNTIAVNLITKLNGEGNHVDIILSQNLLRQIAAAVRDNMDLRHWFPPPLLFNGNDVIVEGLLALVHFHLTLGILLLYIFGERQGRFRLLICPVINTDYG